MLSGELAPRIAWLAGRQYGVVARRQLTVLGATDSQISRRLASGLLIAVHPGVYAVGHGSLSRRGWELAAVLSLGDRALLADRSAAALWGLIDPVGVIEVVVASAKAPRRRGVKVRRAVEISPQDRRRRHGIGVTSALRTLIDLAAIPAFTDLELATARALKRGLVSRPALEARAASERGRPGNPRLRALLGADGGPRLTRSKLERRFLARLREAGLETPRTDFAVKPYVVDFFWARERVIVETDGFETHGVESLFNADRARDADLKARGFEVLRFTWHQIEREPTLVIARLAAVLAIAEERARRSA